MGDVLSTALCSTRPRTSGTLALPAPCTRAHSRVATQVPACIPPCMLARTNSTPELLVSGEVKSSSSIAAERCVLTTARTDGSRVEASVRARSDCHAPLFHQASTARLKCTAVQAAPLLSCVVLQMAVNSGSFASSIAAEMALPGREVKLTPARWLLLQPQPPP